VRDLRIMKVALIHDHLAQDGGAEKVLKALSEIFPEAPIYTLLYEDKVIDNYFRGRRIESSIIQRLPGGVRHYKWYMPFMPMAVEFFDLSAFDVVISDVSAFAKGVITRPETLHICYCHTPTRYLWSDTHSYINELKHNKYFKKVISLVLNYVRIWDRLAADRVDKYIANSRLIARRIEKYYRRDSEVIYPPVDTDAFAIAETVGDYFLVGGRLVPYKRIDIVIQAFNQLRIKNYELRIGDKPIRPKLKIYGDGIDRKRLETLAAGNPAIEFLGRVSDEERNRLYSRCLAFINPQEEDFGITPVEAMASGRPVIVYKKGGVLETVAEGETGEFFLEQTPAAAAAAVMRFDPAKFDPAKIRKHAEKFSTEKFKEEISRFVDEEWRKFNGQL